jgi:general secretion pathway protein D
VIHDQNDLRKIFERKMQERQEFLDRYFVFTGDDWEPPKDFSRTNGLVEDIRQAYFSVEEQMRLEEESQPRAARLHEPGDPIELPGTVRAGAPAAAGAPQPAAKPPQPQPRRPRRPAQPAQPRPAAPPAPAAPAPPKPTGALDSPLILSPMARSVNVERVE